MWDTTNQQIFKKIIQNFNQTNKKTNKSINMKDVEIFKINWNYVTHNDYNGIILILRTIKININLYFLQKRKQKIKWIIEKIRIFG